MRIVAARDRPDGRLEDHEPFGERLVVAAIIDVVVIEVDRLVSSVDHHAAVAGVGLTRLLLPHLLGVVLLAPLRPLVSWFDCFRRGGLLLPGNVLGAVLTPGALAPGTGIVPVGVGVVVPPTPIVIPGTPSLEVVPGLGVPGIVREPSLAPSLRSRVGESSAGILGACRRRSSARLWSGDVHHLTDGCLRRRSCLVAVLLVELGALQDRDMALPRLEELENSCWDVLLVLRLRQVQSAADHQRGLVRHSQTQE